MSSYWKAVSFQPLDLAPYCSTASDWSDHVNGEPKPNPIEIKGSFGIKLNGPSGWVNGKGEHSRDIEK